jgi:hypothetical protein
VQAKINFQIAIVPAGGTSAAGGVTGNFAMLTFRGQILRQVDASSL